MGVYDFAIYRLLDVLYEDVIDLLARGVTGDPKCSPLLRSHCEVFLEALLTTHLDKEQARMWHAVPHDFPFNSPSAVIEHHEPVAAAIDANPNLFIVLDRVSWREAGVPVNNLSFEKYIDAFCFPPSRAGDIVPALTTTTTWDGSLRNIDQPFFPRTAFAVYFLATDDVDLTPYEQNKALEALNGGFEGRKNTSHRGNGGSKPGVYACPHLQKRRDVNQSKELNQRMPNSQRN